MARRGDQRIRSRRGLHADADGAGKLSAPGHGPKIFLQATPIEDTVAFVDALVASPGVHLAPLGPEWSKLRQLCLDKQLAGNDVPDAWLSAAVAQTGEHLVSFDRDFRSLLPRGQITLLAPA